MANARIQRSWNRLRFFFSFFLFAFYLLVSGVFLFTDIWADLLPKQRYIIGIILTLFGILRFFVAYKRYTKKNVKIKEEMLVKEEYQQ